MDEQSVRQQLTETKARLATVEEEREILLSLVHGFEGWLRIHSAPAREPTGKIAKGAEDTVPKGRNAMLGQMSMRSAVRQVIRDAHGAALSSSEILLRARALGAETAGKRPVSVVDLNAMSLQRDGEPVEKVGPRTWRWAEPGVPTPVAKAAV